MHRALALGALVGVVIVAVCISAGGQAGPWSSSIAPRIEYVTHPDDAINLRQPSAPGSPPFVVPAAKALMLYGWSTPMSSFDVIINGSPVWSLSTANNFWTDGTWTTPLVAFAGDTVDMSAAGGSAFLSGYLVDNQTPIPTFRVPFTPTARNIIKFDKNGYTVPAGRMLLMTDWSAVNGGNSIRIFLNGALAWTAHDAISIFSGSAASGSGRFGGPVTAAAGDVVTITSNASVVWIRGYLN